MKNNKGFGKLEIMIVIVLILLVFAGGGVVILRGAQRQRITTMKDNAQQFAKSVVTNGASFRSTSVVYLDEAIDGEYYPKIKNSMGAGYCDPTQTRVNIIDGQSYTTLRCGDYLIDQSMFKANVEVPIYKVSDWTDKKIEGDNVEERILYNCLKDGKEVFDTYYEDFYFVYKVFKEYNQEFYVASNVKGVCEVTNKTFYRTKDKVEQK